ncbi:MAG: Tim44/TimA family putative adaptor protein [Pseudomonadota bacterium]
MEIILLAMLTAFVFYRLWTVLGTRTGEEKTREWRVTAKTEPNTIIDSDNIIVLPNRKIRPAEPAIKNTRTFESALTQLKTIDTTFNEDSFLTGAARAFEKIVLAYASGELAQLKKLLSKEVYTKFLLAIEQRQQQNNHMEAIIDFVDGDIIDAKTTKASASIIVQFQSEQMLATLNAEGVSFDNPARLKTKVIDIWTFKRVFSSTSSIWLLVKTESKHD